MPPATAPSTAPATQASAEPLSLEDAIKLIDARPDWTDFPPINIPRHPAEKHLRGMVIVIDPGHGGEDGGDNSKQSPGYKAGPTGAKEAHMNLRVSLLLRRLLADAGAIVVMTREGDDTISLTQRAQVANNITRPDGGRGANLFISVHHNAAGNRASNYSSVWYHGAVDDNEVELDVAKYIAHELAAELRTDAARTSPVLSSHLMYPTGFGVLRACKVPAILLESSFYTNPAEEQRLRDAGHNLREAYAVYRGLCEYAYGGRPTQSKPIIEIGEGSKVVLVTTLNDGLPQWWGADRPRILSSTVKVKVEDDSVAYAFDPLTRELRASFDLSGDEATVQIHHQNMFKHSNWPQRYALNRTAGSQQVTVEPLPPVRGQYLAPATAPATTQATGIP
ncbi:MAG TPA: N-acetylmuramoyl-L-alanine amidase [Tepidisphaeraceae bacterium]|nr:N-acetylmuramoyl-L-alanine amidase [Tepidisphaeraceae bacterium]